MNKELGTKVYKVNINGEEMCIYAVVLTSFGDYVYSKVTANGVLDGDTFFGLTDEDLKSAVVLSLKQYLIGRLKQINRQIAKINYAQSQGCTCAVYLKLEKQKIRAYESYANISKRLYGYK